MTKIERIQQVLKDAGVYPFKVDNDFGRKSRTALNQADRATIKLVQAVLGFVGNDADGKWGVLSEGRLQAAIAGKEDPTEAPQGDTPAPVLIPGGLNMGADHWLVGVWRQPLPGRGTLHPRGVLLHFTGGADGDGDINGDHVKDIDSAADVMAARKLSCHFIVDRDGTIVQCVPCNQVASHAGLSQWVDPSDGSSHSGNEAFIGIEQANAGDDMAGAGSWARKHVPGFDTIHATHFAGASEGGNEWEIFYPAQVASVLALTKLLVAHYGLSDVTGHDRITQRKNDPGPAFQQHLLAIRAACGFVGMPAVHRSPL